MSDEQIRRTKIIATLGPATDSPGTLRELINVGTNVVRLNLSHGTAEDHIKRAETVPARQALSSGREVAILADLQGPKIRVRRFAEGGIDLVPGASFVLDCREETPPGTVERVGTTHLGLWQDVRPGDTLLLDDGLLALSVAKIQGKDVVCEVEVGGRLTDRKGINKLGGGLSVPALTDKDREDIRLAARMKVDYLAVSFVRSAQDMQDTRALARMAGSGAALCAKLERAEAIANLGEIIDASDAVMVARGDLAVEIGDAELPGLQKWIIREAVARSRVVITATQMMQSMVEAPVPTRAEVMDVANAVIDGTDAVMLSAETASGKYPVKAVEAMNRVCLGAERHFTPVDALLASPPSLERTDQAIAMGTMFLANRVKVRAIIALTESGGTAQWLSRYRSTVPIFAMSRMPEARRKMALFRDVYPLHFDPQGGNPDARRARGGATAVLAGPSAVGDRVILTTGDHTGELGGTNTLKLLRVGPSGMAEGLGDL
jgi:pyruvate kinase